MVDLPDRGEDIMSIVVRFPLSNVTKQQYDSVHAERRRLTAAPVAVDVRLEFDVRDCLAHQRIDYAPRGPCQLEGEVDAVQYRMLG
jgi:hypothetical protein